MSAQSAQSTTRRSLAGAMGVMAASLATSASAAPVGPWALSEFLDAVEKDSVERVTFDDAGKALVAVDADGGRHRVEILPSEGPEIPPPYGSIPSSSRSSRRRRTAQGVGSVVEFALPAALLEAASSS